MTKFDIRTSEYGYENNHNYAFDEKRSGIVTIATTHCESWPPTEISIIPSASCLIPPISIYIFLASFTRSSLHPDLGLSNLHLPPGLEFLVFGFFFCP
jgi:hypothetical protein